LGVSVLPERHFLMENDEFLIGQLSTWPWLHLPEDSGDADV
jgi:hypothetical protein